MDKNGIKDALRYYNEALTALTLAAGTLNAAVLRGEDLGGLLTDTQRVRIKLSMIKEVLDMFAEQNDQS